MLKLFIDADNELDESVETDNTYITLAVYEPYDLDADPDHMISHSPPPDRNPEGYTNYSCDGYQFSVQPTSGQNYWGAIGLLSTSSTSNYNLRLHDDYTGSTHGFEDWIIRSNSGGDGEIEIIGINRRQSGVATWWTGVVQASNTPYTSTYSIHRALSGSPLNVPNSGTSGSIPASAIVAIKEIYIDSSDIGSYWRFLVTPSGGDIGLAMINRTEQYFSLNSAITGTWVNNAGTDSLEYFDFKPTASGYYGLLIYKPDSSELIHTINLNLIIELSPSNLTSFAQTGWTAPIVARSSTGCTLNSCLVTATLPGGTGTTYVNSTNINEGPLDINTGFQIRYLLDDTTLEEGTFTSLDADAIALDYNNPLAQPIKGGRHTLGMFIDANDNYNESNETDNTYYAQYVWSPKLLSDNIPYSSSAPPDRDTAGAIDFNCDGYAFVVENDGDEKYWGAVGILPSTGTANYDLRLHDDYTGATQGFETVLKSSNSSTAGGVDIIGANRNISSTINWFAGVIQGSTTPSTSTYTICKDASGFKVPLPVTGRVGSIPTNGIVSIEEILIESTDENRVFRFMVTPSGGDIGIALIDYSVEYFRLGDAIPGTKVDSGGTNVAEQFDFIPTHYGYYALLIYKPDYSELANNRT
ncbi:MAG: hypothetical protein A2Y62_08405 [Candidatus Fischerbacteria bacterium RBG_13_37_8]|uniref:CARDB domain-containing protein n=1 Tax=Candidatus Fischerbacteria bacterium RBG_13_37_8 TaxID=1817863 RepID=A0A1F5VLR3_9BACT|nr:MAG: hypothetical protein A2Y62_08405 [Candidatus Fischerbacteria bacterium RBG_13_37_8]